MSYVIYFIPVILSNKIHTAVSTHFTRHIPSIYFWREFIIYINGFVYVISTTEGRNILYRYIKKAQGIKLSYN